MLYNQLYTESSYSYFSPINFFLDDEGEKVSKLF